MAKDTVDFREQGQTFAVSIPLLNQLTGVLEDSQSQEEN